MTLRYSTGARNYMAQFGGFKDAFQNGKIEIYSGSQPASADAAVTGTLLCTITDASAARTAETLATGTVTLNTGAAGSVDTLTVDGISLLAAAVPFNTSLTQTAADVVTAINANSVNSAVKYFAYSVGAVITIRALRGTGAAPNGFVVASTVTTITKTDVNMAGGVAAANGLKFGAASAASIAKLASQTWSGVNVASATAGYYRAYGSVTDAGALDSDESTIREDGAIATSGAQLNLSSTSLTVAATTTITSWSRSLPAA